MPDIVTVVGRRRPSGMTMDTFLQMQAFAEEAQTKEVFCRHTEQLQYYLEDEADERQDAAAAIAIGGIATGGAVALTGVGVLAGAAIGGVSTVGGAVLERIGNRYADDARQVSRMRDRIGC